MSFTWMIAVLTAISLLLGIANTIGVWMTKGSAALAARLKVLADNQDNHGVRIQAIEGELQHLPSKDDVNALKVTVAEINGSIATLDAEVMSVGRTARRIEDHLLGVK